MNSLAKRLALLTLLLAAPTSQAADIVLREQATQHGAIIRLGDIADIAATSAAEMRALAGTPLMPAPATGTQQYLSSTEVRELLIARGIQVDAVLLLGATTIELGSVSSMTSTVPQKANTTIVTSTIGRKSTTSGDTSQPTTRPVTTLEPTFQELEMQVQQAIEQIVRSVATTVNWRVEFSLSQNQIEKLASLGTTLEARQVQPLRPGRQRFLLKNTESGKELAIFASLIKIQSVVVVQNPIERGQLVRSSDVELIEREGNVPSGSIFDVEQVVGKVAQRSLRTDDIIQTNHLRAPWQVRRGETVNAYVRTGGIVVRTRALAKQDGAMGDLITIETLQDKQRLDVSVSGPGEVTVYATGGRATEYASLDRDTRSGKQPQRR